jgi:hypothetical protein
MLADPERDDGALVDEELVPDAELGPAEGRVPDDPPAVVPGDDPVLVLVDMPAAPPVACAEPGRVKASPPATASPRAPVPAVPARRRLRARSRRATADTVRWSLLFIITPSRKVTPLDFRNGLWLRFALCLRRL